TDAEIGHALPPVAGKSKVWTIVPSQGSDRHPAAVAADAASTIKRRSFRVGRGWFTEVSVGSAQRNACGPEASTTGFCMVRTADRQLECVLRQGVDRNHGAVTGWRTACHQLELTGERTSGRYRSCKGDHDTGVADTF